MAEKSPTVMLGVTHLYTYRTENSSRIVSKSCVTVYTFVFGINTVMSETLRTNKQAMSTTNEYMDALQSHLL